MGMRGSSGGILVCKGGLRGDLTCFRLFFSFAFLNILLFSRRPGLVWVLLFLVLLGLAVRRASLGIRFTFPLSISVLLVVLSNFWVLGLVGWEDWW